MVIMCHLLFSSIKEIVELKVFARKVLGHKVFVCPIYHSHDLSNVDLLTTDRQMSLHTCRTSNSSQSLNYLLYAQQTDTLAIVMLRRPAAVEKMHKIKQDCIPPYKYLFLILRKCRIF